MKNIVAAPLQERLNDRPGFPPRNRRKSASWRPRYAIPKTGLANLNKAESSDLYRWKIIPGQEEALSKLFSKSISDHSIGAYRQLCEGVDKTFEAIPTSPPIEKNIPIREHYFNNFSSFSVLKLVLAPEFSNLKMKMLVSSMSYASGKIGPHLNVNGDSIWREEVNRQANSKDRR
jgi:hypothetical protein